VRGRKRGTAAIAKTNPACPGYSKGCTDLVDFDCEGDLDALITSFNLPKVADDEPEDASTKSKGKGDSGADKGEISELREKLAAAEGKVRKAFLLGFHAGAAHKGSNSTAADAQDYLAKYASRTGIRDVFLQEQAGEDDVCKKEHRIIAELRRGILNDQYQESQLQRNEHALLKLSQDGKEDTNDLNSPSVQRLLAPQGPSGTVLKDSGCDTNGKCKGNTLFDKKKCSAIADSCKCNGQKNFAGVKMCKWQVPGDDKDDKDDDKPVKSGKVLAKCAPKNRCRLCAPCWGSKGTDTCRCDETCVATKDVPAGHVQYIGEGWKPQSGGKKMHSCFMIATEESKQPRYCVKGAGCVTMGWENPGERYMVNGYREIIKVERGKTFNQKVGNANYGVYPHMSPRFVNSVKRISKGTKKGQPKCVAKLAFRRLSTIAMNKNQSEKWQKFCDKKWANPMDKNIRNGEIGGTECSMDKTAFVIEASICNQETGRCAAKRATPMCYTWVFTKGHRQCTFDELLAIGPSVT